MLQNLTGLFSKGPIPHMGVDAKNPDKDYSSTWDIVAGHSEVARPEYNYTWNSDGLRSVDFSTRPDVVALGCSVALGQGLPVWARWSDLLAKRIGQPVGNISYSGSSISKNVSSFFGLVHKYNYAPKVLVCSFADFNRVHFVSGDGKFMRDWFMHHFRPKVTAEMPWVYGEILPYEWVYMHNLDHIKMLEAFCSQVGTKLIWSTWCNIVDSEDEDYIRRNFASYVPDPDRQKFPPNFEFGPGADSVAELTNNYAMLGWQDVHCHSEYQAQHPDIFHYGYDFHAIPPQSKTHWPHPGLHRQLHLSDFFFDQLQQRGWL